MGQWYFLIAGTIAAVFGFIKWKKTPRGRSLWQRSLLRMPFKIGDIFQKVALARWSRTFSALMGAGVPLLQAIDITSQTAGNIVVEEAMATGRIGSLVVGQRLPLGGGVQVAAVDERLVCEDADGAYEWGALGVPAGRQSALLCPSGELALGGEPECRDLVCGQAMCRLVGHGAGSWSANSISCRSPRRSCGGWRRPMIRWRPRWGSSKTISTGSMRSAARRATAPRRRTSSVNSARSAGS